MESSVVTYATYKVSVGVCYTAFFCYIEPSTAQFKGIETRLWALAITYTAQTAVVLSYKDISSPQRVAVTVQMYHKDNTLAKPL